VQGNSLSGCGGEKEKKEVPLMLWRPKKKIQQHRPLVVVVVVVETVNEAS
jgi:hypothetical protein